MQNGLEKRRARGGTVLRNWNREERRTDKNYHRIKANRTWWLADGNSRRRISNTWGHFLILELQGSFLFLLGPQLEHFPSLPSNWVYHVTEFWAKIINRNHVFPIQAWSMKTSHMCFISFPSPGERRGLCTWKRRSNPQDWRRPRSLNDCMKAPAKQEHHLGFTWLVMVNYWHSGLIGYGG